jgi:anti-repressor protein
MNELIKIDNDRMVCGKELHAFLGVKTKFGDWFKRRVEEYGFVQPLDFTLLRNEHNEIKELRISLDVAKEICMVEKTDRGREARRYFIEAEKTLRAGATKAPATSLEVLQATVNALVEQEKRVAYLEDRQAVIEAKVKLLSSDSEYRTVRGMGNQLGISIPRDQANLIGRRAGAICRRENIVIGKVPDERDGQVNSYPIHIVKAVIETWQKGVL